MAQAPRWKQVDLLSLLRTKASQWDLFSSLSLLSIFHAEQNSLILFDYDFVCSFEKTLKQKLSQKASGATNEETVLLKAFKYFDLNNNGTVEPDEFAKAVEKIGIMIPTRQVSYEEQARPNMQIRSISYGLLTRHEQLCKMLCQFF